jgi:hypothetical protein
MGLESYVLALQLVLALVGEDRKPGLGCWELIFLTKSGRDNYATWAMPRATAWVSQGAVPPLI